MTVNHYDVNMNVNISLDLSIRQFIKALTPNNSLP